MAASRSRSSPTTARTKRSGSSRARAKPKQPAITIRAARPADRRAVRQISARIWTDDYVPDAFAEWVRDRRGRLWVACIGGRVVGFAKLSVVGDREAWLHGLRVDPRYRRIGVAGALLDHRLGRARALGVRVARLDTADDNRAVQRMAARRGFRLIARVGYFRAPAHRGELPESARRTLLAALWRLARDGDDLLNDSHVRRRIARADVARALRQGACVVVMKDERPLAFAIVRSDPPALGVTHLAGRGRAASDLLRRLRALARARGLKRVAIGGPSQRWRALGAAGYERRWEPMLVFEKVMR